MSHRLSCAKPDFIEFAGVKFVANASVLNVSSEPNAMQATAGKTVSVLYTGRLINGTVFDASSQHGNKPIEFVLGRGQVIQGWDEGIALMRKGEKATLLSWLM